MNTVKILLCEARLRVEGTRSRLYAPLAPPLKSYVNCVEDVLLLMSVFKTPDYSKRYRSYVPHTGNSVILTKRGARVPSFEVTTRVHLFTGVSINVIIPLNLRHLANP